MCSCSCVSTVKAAGPVLMMRFRNTAVFICRAEKVLCLQFNAAFTTHKCFIPAAALKENSCWCLMCPVACYLGRLHRVCAPSQHTSQVLQSAPSPGTLPELDFLFISCFVLFLCRSISQANFILTLLPVVFMVQLSQSVVDLDVTCTFSNNLTFKTKRKSFQAATVRRGRTICVHFLELMSE